MTWLYMTTPKQKQNSSPFLLVAKEYHKVSFRESVEEIKGFYFTNKMTRSIGIGNFFEWIIVEEKSFNFGCFGKFGTIVSLLFCTLFGKKVLLMSLSVDDGHLLEFIEHVTQSFYFVSVVFSVSLSQNCLFVCCCCDCFDSETYNMR